MTPLGQYYGIVALSGVADAAVTYTPYRTGLKLWYDAADVNSGSGQPTDGDSIGLWKNLSGFTSVAAGGHTDLTMSVAANQPVFVESIPYLSGSQSDSLTYPAMKWFNQDGSQGVNSAMVTSGSLFGGGAGGAAPADNSGTQGSTSTFSTISSAGGGEGGAGVAPQPAGAGGSGGGASY